MSGLKITVPDPGYEEDDPTFPRVGHAGYVGLHNESDHPFRVTIAVGTTYERELVIGPRELAPVYGRELHQVRIQGMPRPGRRPRAGLMRFSRG